MQSQGKFFASAFQHSPLGILIFSLNRGIILDVNDAFLGVTGYQRADLLGRPLPEIGLWVNPVPGDCFPCTQGEPGSVRDVEAAYRRKDGEVRLGLVTIEAQRDEGEGSALVYLQDISGRKQAEQALLDAVDQARAAEERFRTISEITTDFAYSYSIGPGGRLVREWITDSYDRLTGYTTEDRDARGGWPFPVHPDDIPEVIAVTRHILATGQPVEFDYRLVARSGKILWVRSQIRPELDEQGQVRRIIGSGQDITARRLADEKHAVIIRTALDGFNMVDSAGRYLEVNDAFCQLTGYSRDELLAMTLFDLSTTLHTAADLQQRIEAMKRTGSSRYETQLRCKNGSLVDVDISVKHLEGEETSLVAFVRDVTARKQIEMDLRRRVGEMEAVNRISTALRSADTLGDMLRIFLAETLAVLDLSAGLVALYEYSTRQLYTPAASGWFSGLASASVDTRQGLIGEVIATGEPAFTDEIASDPRLPESVRQRARPGWRGIILPIQAVRELVGMLMLGIEKPRELSLADLSLLGTLAEIAGNAIQRMRLHERTRRGLQRLATLHEIDRAISSSTDLRLTLGVILGYVIKEQDMDAACILLANPGTTWLEYTAWEGFKTRRLQQVMVPAGVGIAGRAFNSSGPAVAADISLSEEPPARARLFQEEGFVTVCAVAFRNKDNTAGVLEVYKRSPVSLDEEWLRFFDSLSGQLSIAVENARMLENLHRSNAELILAYDATIEVLSQAMDLRDQDTEGHSLRVASLALDLARELQLPDSLLENLRRGALLHDLGKIGIPDSILNKPGPLTDGEWAIMRRHPQYAYDMLSRVDFLHRAMEIPFYHHEHWDGSGYPQGLKGEQIPLAARVFTVVDVWDALTNDRPYRKAWPKERALEYLRHQAGLQFDPKIVEVFLKMQK